MERDSEWGGGGVKRPAPKRKLVDMHDAGGLILLAVLVSPVLIALGKWLLGM